MDRAGKNLLRENLTERLSKANAVILAEYRGLAMSELTQLRVSLRKSGGEFKISKNRIVKKAIEGSTYSQIADDMRGPLGVVYSYGDVAQVTKSVLDFAKDHENLKVKVGVLEGGVVGTSELEAISSLPSKEVLLAKILGSITAPHRGLVTVLSGVSRNLVQVINAIKDKKEN